MKGLTVFSWPHKKVNGFITPGVINFYKYIYSLDIVTKLFNAYVTNSCFFKVNNRNARKRCEICSNLIIKTPERLH